MVLGRKLVIVTYDMMRGINATVWGGVEEAEKVGKGLKTGFSGADVVIGTSHALEDFTCKDYVCCTLDVVGSVSSATGLILGNIPATKHLTCITFPVTVGCRSVRYYCKTYGTFWGCATAAGQGVKKAIKFTVKK